MTKEITCISCPIGCPLIASESGNGVIEVTGNKCKRGELYGREELLAPKRVVTATVGIRKAALNRLPVKTDGPIPRELIPRLLSRLYTMELSPPICIGDMVIDNFGESGIGVVATRSCEGA